MFGRRRKQEQEHPKKVLPGHVELTEQNRERLLMAVYGVSADISVTAAPDAFAEHLSKRFPEVELNPVLTSMIVWRAIHTGSLHDTLRTRVRIALHHYLFG